MSADEAVERPDARAVREPAPCRRVCPVQQFIEAGRCEAVVHAGEAKDPRERLRSPVHQVGVVEYEDLLQRKKLEVLLELGRISAPRR